MTFLGKRKIDIWKRVHGENVGGAATNHKTGPEQNYSQADWATYILWGNQHVDWSSRVAVCLFVFRKINSFLKGYVCICSGQSSG